DHVRVVPLVPRAMRILEEVLSHHRGCDGEYLFSGTQGRRPLAGWSKAQARMMRAICAESGQRVAVPWTPHDLRRTVATRIAETLVRRVESGNLNRLQAWRAERSDDRVRLRLRNQWQGTAHERLRCESLSVLEIRRPGKVH